MCQGRPTRRDASMGWACKLGMVGILAAAAGCNSGFSSSPGGGAPRVGGRR